MGTAKQLLPWAGATLLSHSVGKAKELQPEMILVVLGANSEEIKPTLKYEGVDVTIHKNWESGLGTSIAWGIEKLMALESTVDGVLVMLADQPLISKEYLEFVQNKFQRDQQAIIASSYSEHKRGVPALFDRCYFEELIRLNGDQGAKEVIQRHSDILVVCDARGLLADIDTLDEYRSLYSANHQL